VGELNEENQLHPALAPDGVRVAVQRAFAGAPHTFLIDGRPKETPTRLMDDPLPEGRPVWSPDGRFVVVNHARQGVGLTVKSLNDPGERVLLTLPEAVSPVDWSTDGQFILFGSADMKTGWDLWGVRADGSSAPFPVVRASADQAHGMFSPNMQWVVYDSNQSGRYEVYIQPFGRPGGKTTPLSAGGGMFPRWRGDGKELFYVAPDGTMMSVAIRETNGDVQPSSPVRLFKEKITGGGAPLLGGTYQYSVARDGKRFLVNVTTDEATVSPITVVLNWPEVLKLRGPSR
jgi:Tol biopolymer transport system component